MKTTGPLFLCLGLLISHSATYALNPVEGFYAGLLVEGSHGPSNDHVVFEEDNMLFAGTVDYSAISGGGGAMLGYKYRHIRLEGEILYNHISTGPLTVGTCTLQSINIITPTGLCPESDYDHFKSKALGYKGSSAAIYGLINAYWDFFSYEGETVLIPYIGVGVGEAKIKNSNNIVNTRTSLSHGQSISTTENAGQGIVGLGYYMDDYSWITLDYRYLTTQNKANTRDKKYTLNTLNLTVNFAFDKGAIGS